VESLLFSTKPHHLANMDISGPNNVTPQSTYVSTSNNGNVGGVDSTYNGDNFLPKINITDYGINEVHPSEGLGGRDRDKGGDKLVCFHLSNLIGKRYLIFLHLLCLLVMPIWLGLFVKGGHLESRFYNPLPCCSFT
jgi:hypothetical protein